MHALELSPSAAMCISTDSKNRHKTIRMLWSWICLGNNNDIGAINSLESTSNQFMYSLLFIMESFFALPA